MLFWIDCCLCYNCNRIWTSFEWYTNFRNKTFTFKSATGGSSFWGYVNIVVPRTIRASKQNNITAPRLRVCMNICLHTYIHVPVCHDFIYIYKCNMLFLLFIDTTACRLPSALLFNYWQVNYLIQIINEFLI